MKANPYVISQNATNIDTITQELLETGIVYGEKPVSSAKYNAYWKYTSAYVNNINQELDTILTAAGDTPNDTATQLLGSLTKLLCPIGNIKEYAGRTAPIGFLMADGTAVSRTTYLNLFNVLCPLIGTFTITIATPGVITLNSHGLSTGEQIYLTTTGALPTGLTANTLYYVIYVDANTIRLATSRANAIAGTAINTSGTQSETHSLYSCAWGLGDGSTTFNVPDKREASSVGIGTRGSGITAHDIFNLGEFKDDQMQGHKHYIDRGDGSRLLVMDGTGTGGVIHYATGVTTYSTPITETPYSDGTNGTPRTGTTTHGKQIGMNFIIKY